MSAHHRTAAWQRTTRSQRPIIAAQLPAPCIDCGCPVHAAQRWQVGHRIPAAVAKAMGWTVEQINAPSNLGPTHTKGRGQRACNQIAGGRLGAQRSRASKPSTSKRMPSW